MPKPLSTMQRDFVEAYRQGLGARAAAALSEDELCRAALLAAAHVEAEMARLQRSGALKAVNKAYRTYRLDASSRGERVTPYGVWLARYKADRVREVAAHLR